MRQRNQPTKWSRATAVACRETSTICKSRQAVRLSSIPFISIAIKGVLSHVLHSRRRRNVAANICGTSGPSSTGSASTSKQALISRRATASVSSSKSSSSRRYGSYSSSFHSGSSAAVAGGTGFVNCFFKAAKIDPWEPYHLARREMCCPTTPASRPSGRYHSLLQTANPAPYFAAR